MEWLTWLQESEFSQWVGAAPTLLAYPTILTLHTVGLSIVVGTCVLVDLRLLGVASDVPLSVFRTSSRLVWGGFIVNAITGGLLFLPDAEHKAFQLIFHVKLALIVIAMWLYVRIGRLVFSRQPSAGHPFVPREARLLAALSLIAWTGATVAGRLMAYIL